jgi:formate dehydrogenase major subunit
MNKLTGDHHDPDVNTPAYKETAVRIEVLQKPKGMPPLPHNNYRYGHRTPNEGTVAEVKWARSDYAEPPAGESHPERV